MASTVGDGGSAGAPRVAGGVALLLDEGHDPLPALADDGVRGDEAPLRLRARHQRGDLVRHRRARRLAPEVVRVRRRVAVVQAVHRLHQRDHRERGVRGVPRRHGGVTQRQHQVAVGLGGRLDGGGADDPDPVPGRRRLVFGVDPGGAGGGDDGGAARRPGRAGPRGRVPGELIRIVGAAPGGEPGRRERGRGTEAPGAMGGPPGRGRLVGTAWGVLSPAGTRDSRFRAARPVGPPAPRLRPRGIGG